jgi:peptide/nickel transport system substrate-binding protein
LQGPWWQGYENKQVNDLIKQAEAQFDDHERQKIYRQIYSIIRDDAPWIFLYRPARYWGIKSTMKDWKLRSDGLLIFN